MRHFALLLRGRGFRVLYNEWDETAPKTIGEGVCNALEYHDFDAVLIARPGDYRVLEVLKQTVGQKLTVVEDTHFLTTPDEFQLFLKGRKRVVLEDFYHIKRKKTGWLMDGDGKPEGGQWNFDKQNRGSFSKGNTPLIPERVTFEPDKITQDVIALVNTQYPDAPGSVDDFCEPVSRSDALDVLNDFVNNRLQDFGAYQDAMTFN